MRKKLIWLNLFLIVIMLLSACATPTPEVVEVTVEKVVTEVVKETVIVEKPAEVVEKVVTPTPPPAAKYAEAPMLANLVERGKLPSVEERLPINPMVVEPLVEQGAYGGDMRFGFVGGSVSWGGMLYLAAWEHLVTWRPDFNSIEPNVVAGWDINDAATEYTFYLRKGMKWSDGAPFMADDILFYINDVIGNEELFPGGIGADWLPSDMKEGFKAEKIDDYTVKITFPKPYGTFLYQLATWGGRQFTQYPKHFLEQYHADYNPNIDELIAADDTVEDWIALFFKMAPGTWGDPERFFQDTDIPSVGPWITVQPMGMGTTVILERNPYYWKVDTEGNQLPYIDKIIGTSYQDAESRTFAMMNGDLDWIKDPGEPNREIYYDALDEGKPIKIVSARPDGGNTQSIHFNLTVKDPVKNEIFNDLDFRIGMSHAINRGELIEVIFKGQGEPAQVAPLETSPIYHEQLGTQYLEYDVELANEYLDKVLPEKDAEGFRLDSEGNRLSIVFTVINDLSYGAHYEEIAELMIGYWKEVGVEVLMNSITDAVWGEQRERNDVEMFLFHGGEGGAGLTAILDPRWHVPGEHWGIFGLGWTLWGDGVNVENENAVEPPQYVKDIQDLYSEAIQQPSIDGQIEVMKRVMQASADNFWVIGVSRPGMGYQPMSERLENVPDGYWDGWLEGVHKIIRPEQWYLK